MLFTTVVLSFRHPQPPESGNPQIFTSPHNWPVHHETPGMTATSRPLVLTRAKARAMGIPLPDLLGPGFTRLFHDT